MLSAIGLSGSPSTSSKSRRLLAHALQTIAASGFTTTLVDLCELPAAALLAREKSIDLSAAHDQLAAASIVVASTPVYRATYSGLLKVFFDLLPPSALAGKIAVPIATGGGPLHALVIDHGLRPLFASTSALVTATGIYGTDAQFTAEGIDPELIVQVEHASREAVALAALHPFNSEVTP